LPYLGKNYPLRILKEKEAGHNSIEFIDCQFITKTKSSKESTTKNTTMIKKLYEDWFMEKAQLVFKHKVEEYSEKLGVKPEKIIIKNLKNRWGSMTKEGSINLNVNLLKAPEDIIDYIILHELCHLKIKEHSHHYWDYVHRYMPDYQKKLDWLKVHGTILV
jgi:predicted metal-dependent hydrolase